jgi:RNA polymerase sigma-70 factor (ECF subfamily)
MPNLLQNLKSDESLMLAYQKGDSIAFEVLYMRHKDQLFNFLFYSCRQYQLVEDLAHDTWLSVIRSVENYRPVATFRTYLYRIARNHLIDHWRRKGQYTVGEVEYNEQLHLESSGQAALPQNAAYLKEILEAINRLPKEQREAFLLRQEGFSQQEIAEITNCKPETVKSRVRYATKSLRSMEKVAS